MSFTYDTRRRTARAGAEKREASAPERAGLSRGGGAAPSSPGGGAALDAAMRARMEATFDLSAAKESGGAPSPAPAPGTAYGGATAPLTVVSAAPAAGPMQASRATAEQKNRRAANRQAMEAAINGSLISKGSEGYEQGQAAQNSFVDNATSTTMGEADEFSAEGVFNAEWEKVSKKYNKLTERDAKISPELRRRFTALYRLKSQMADKRLNNTLAGLDVKQGDKGYDRATEMRKDYLARVARDGSNGEKEIDIGTNFAWRYRQDQDNFKNAQRDGGKRMSHLWKEKDQKRHDKFTRLKDELDGKEVQQPEAQQPAPKQESAPQQNEMLEKLLKMKSGVRSSFVNSMANGNGDDETMAAYEALKNEYRSLSEKSVDRENNYEVTMSDENEARFKMLNSLMGEIRDKEHETAAAMRKKQIDEEKQKDIDNMLALMDGPIEWEE